MIQRLDPLRLDPIRSIRRFNLLKTINGSPEDILAYVNYRALKATRVRLAVFGSAVYDEAQLARLAQHWFARLSKLAKKVRES